MKLGSSIDAINAFTTAGRTVFRHITWLPMLGEVEYLSAGYDTPDREYVLVKKADFDTMKDQLYATSDGLK